MELDLNVPDPGPVPGVVIENCVIVKGAGGEASPLIESLELRSRYSRTRRRRLELASGAIAMDVGALSLPFTEICESHGATGRNVGGQGEVDLIFTGITRAARVIHRDG